MVTSDEPISRLIGVGSAVTSATNQRRNQEQHGVELNKDDLIAQQDAIKDKLTQRFDVVGELKEELQRHTLESREYKELREDLVRYFGLRMITHILDRLDFTTITVNGMGLRYGVIYEMLEQYYPDLQSKKYHPQFKDHSFSVDNVTECTYNNGIVHDISNMVS